MRSKPGRQVIEWNVIDRKQVIHHAASDDVVLLTGINTRLITSATARSEIGEDGTTGSIETEYVMGWQRDEWSPRVVATSKIATTPSDFVLRGEMNAYDGEEKVFARTWERKIPRQLV